MNAVPKEIDKPMALVGAVEEAQPVTTITTPATLLALAIQQGAGLETLERLMDLQDRHDAKQAERAFNVAFAAFKANPPAVLKNKENKQYNSMYATLDSLVNTVNAALADHGLTTSWDIKQEAQIEVTCILAHVDGHSKRVTMKGAPDTSGAKNALQQIKSTTTYLKGATFEAVTGIASSERTGVNRDDDGNGSGDYDTTEWTDAIEGASDLTELNRIGDQIKAAKGIPKGPLANIRAAWSARAKELKS